MMRVFSRSKVEVPVVNTFFRTCSVPLFYIQEVKVGKEVDYFAHDSAPVLACQLLFRPWGP